MNNFLHSMFKQVDVFLKEKQVTQATGTYAYRAYLETLLDKQSYAWDFNRRKLQSAWSDVCGQYCIFYLSHIARGQSMNTIVQLFDNNTMLI